MARNIIAHPEELGKPETRREILRAATFTAIVMAMPSPANAQGDPLPELVERFLPLFERSSRLNEELERKYDHYAQIGHPRLPIYQYGTDDDAKTIVYEGNTDRIVIAFNELIENVIDEGSRLFTVAQMEVRRSYFEQQRDFHVAKARELWERWRQEHEDLGLAQLERESRAADEAVDPIESQIRDAKPKTMAGVIALLRYALAYDYRSGTLEEDQPPCAYSLMRVLAFLDPAKGTGG